MQILHHTLTIGCYGNTDQSSLETSSITNWYLYICICWCGPDIRVLYGILPQVRICAGVQCIHAFCHCVATSMPMFPIYSDVDLCTQYQCILLARTRNTARIRNTASCGWRSFCCCMSPRQRHPPALSLLMAIRCTCCWWCWYVHP